MQSFRKLQEYVELAQGRSNTYHLLSIIFSEPPTTNLLQSIQTGFLPQFFKLVEKDFIKLDKELDDVLLGKLSYADDFSSLFQVPTNRYVTPYESVYRQKTMGGEYSAVVKQLYSYEGIDVAKLDDLPDHIALELDFMRFLINNEAESWKKRDKKIIKHYLEVENAFLENHILIWFPKLAATIQKNAIASFYKEISNATEQFIQQDLQEIKLLTNELISSSKA